jgi:hypothetical protein
MSTTGPLKITRMRRGIVLNNSCEVSSRSMGNSCRGLQLKWKTTPPEALPVTKEKFK